ncbi:hypothetical protein SAMN05192552_10931, partial [Natrinema hispanicum]
TFHKIHNWFRPPISGFECHPAFENLMLAFGRLFCELESV